MATYKPYKKTDSGKEEIKIPYSVLSNPPTIPTKASDVNALSLDGGTIKKSKTIKMDASANSNGANLKWGTVNSKNPYIGYASDQVDGTFVVGSLLGTNYASGLAIGGGSGNLLWKGTKVATTSDIPDVSGKANLNGGNTWNGWQDFLLPANSSFYVSDQYDSTIFSVSAEEGVALGNDVPSPILLNYDPGATGQVLTSQGADKTPIWTNPAIKSATLSGTTLTITL